MVVRYQEHAQEETNARQVNTNKPKNNVLSVRSTALTLFGSLISERQLPVVAELWSLASSLTTFLPWCWSFLFGDGFIYRQILATLLFDFDPSVMSSKGSPLCHLSMRVPLYGGQCVVRLQQSKCCLATHDWTVCSRYKTEYFGLCQAPTPAARKALNHFPSFSNFVLNQLFTTKLTKPYWHPTRSENLGLFFLLQGYHQKPAGLKTVCLAGIYVRCQPANSNFLMRTWINVVIKSLQPMFLFGLRGYSEVEKEATGQ